MIVKAPFSIHSKHFSKCLFWAQSYLRGGASLCGRGKGVGPMWQFEGGVAIKGGLGSTSVWSVEDETQLCSVGGSLILPVTAKVAISILNAEGVSEKPFSLLI